MQIKLDNVVFDMPKEKLKEAKKLKDFGDGKYDMLYKVFNETCPSYIIKRYNKNIHDVDNEMEKYCSNSSCYDCKKSFVNVLMKFKQTINK